MKTVQTVTIEPLTSGYGADCVAWSRDLSLAVGGLTAGGIEVSSRTHQAAEVYDLTLKMTPAARKILDASPMKFDIKK